VRLHNTAGLRDQLLIYGRETGGERRDGAGTIEEGFLAALETIAADGGKAGKDEICREDVEGWELFRYVVGREEKAVNFVKSQTVEGRIGSMDQGIPVRCPFRHPFLGIAWQVQFQ
jgi:hypothetical protein